MKLGRVVAGHWKDEDQDADFSRREDFADDCRDHSKVAVGKFNDGFPFDRTTSTADVNSLSSSDIKEMYEKNGVSERKAKNAAAQVIRFRDWPTGLPLFLYCGDNEVAGMGILTGEYEYQHNGYFGEEYGYPHVRGVEWFDTPRMFDRNLFPKSFQGWLKNQQTVLDHDVSSNTESENFLSACFKTVELLNEASEFDPSDLG